jgi:Zn-dependent protease with chaperone function
VSQERWKALFKWLGVGLVVGFVFSPVAVFGGIALLFGFPIYYMTGAVVHTRPTIVPNSWKDHWWFELLASGVVGFSLMFFVWSVGFLRESDSIWTVLGGFFCLGGLAVFLYIFLAVWEGLLLVNPEETVIGSGVYDQLRFFRPLSQTTVDGFWAWFNEEISPQEEKQAATPVQLPPTPPEPPKRLVAVAPSGNDLYWKTLGYEFFAGTWRAWRVIRWGLILFLPVMAVLFWIGQLGVSFNMGTLFSPGPGVTGWGQGWLWLYAIGVGLVALVAGYGRIVFSFGTWHWDDEVQEDEVSLVEGARAISKNSSEFVKIQQAHAIVAKHAGSKVREPAEWEIIESPIPNSYTVGNKIFLTRGAIDSPHLAALMAHELGHLQQRDGQKLLALRRLIVNTAYTLGIDTQPEAVGSLVGGQMMITSNDQQMYYRVKGRQFREEIAWLYGGLGLFRLESLWFDFWRSHDFAADYFVYSIGMAPQLIATLEAHAQFDVAQPYRMSGRPYARERIEHLYKLLGQPMPEPQPAEVVQPAKRSPGRPRQKPLLPVEGSPASSAA